MKKVILHLQKDRTLSKLIEQYPFPNLKQSNFIYKDLVKSIISQQLSVKAADTIYGRFHDLLHTHINDPKALLEIPHDNLRAVGLSTQKAKYVKHVAEFFLNEKHEETDWKALSDEEIIKNLTSIKGVGAWTAQMVLMFSMERSDVFASGDLSIQQKMKELYSIEETGKALILKMHEIAEFWIPYRTYACLYLWQWKDN